MPPTNAHSPQPTSTSSGRLARVSADPAPLFVYGTLLFPDVVRVLLDRDPTLIPDPTSTATGHLLTDLALADWQILDAFEDTRYQLASLTTADGHRAYAYIDPNSNSELTAAPPWDTQHFADTHLPTYLKRCITWRHHHDDASIT